MYSSLGSSIGNLAGNLFGDDPYQGAIDEYGKAQNALNQYLNKSTGYLDPYYKAGTDALPQYQNALSKYADPSQFYNNMMSGYQESPAAMFRQNQATNAANARAAATGLSGSSNNLDDVSNITQGIIGQDQQQYFNNMMGINNNYLSGLGGLTGMGMNAANNYGNLYGKFGEDISSLYGNIAKARAEQTQRNNDSIGSDISDVIGIGTSLLGFL